MRGKTILAAIILGASAMGAAAQTQPAFPLTPGDVNCAGIVTSDAVPRDTYVITGEQANYQIVFTEGDDIYINKGSSQGAKVGDRFSLVRPVTDAVGEDWTAWETSLIHKMGTVWEDQGQARLIVVHENVSIAKVEHSCNYIQRGDIALPYTPRPVLTPRATNFDRFTPSDGKMMAMVVTGKMFQQQVAKNDIVYVNLGAGQGVKVGDYFRVFRYVGTQHESAYATARFAFDTSYGMSPTYGFGTVPKKWNWSNVPRENLGEGIVLRTGPNSATVLITFALREIFPGDYVELE